MKARQHLEHLERRIAEGDVALIRMATHFDEVNGVCCPGCMFGRQWYALEEKQERRRRWADQLRAKIERDSR